MNFLPELLAVALIHLLAVMSPGPDFILISRNSLVYSRRTGILSAIGLGLGILVHVSYSLIGVGFLIAQSVLLYSVIKFLGAAYLIWIGYHSLRAKPQAATGNTGEHRPDMTPFAAVRVGFLTNLLNPKATLFFFALFTQVIHPTTPKYIQAIYGIEMSIATFAWFATVAIVLSHAKIRSRFAAIQHWAERTFGVILIALGLRIAFSEK